MKNLWNVSKSISLIMVASAVLFFSLGWQPFAPTNITADAYAVEENVAATTSISVSDIVVDTYNIEEGSAQAVSVPYTSIYDVKLNDRQLLAVTEYIDQCILYQVSQELPECTPNEYILRCAYYNASQVENALNHVLGVTLSADWRTDEYFTPDGGESVSNQAANTDNGYGYNGYGDLIE